MSTAISNVSPATAGAVPPTRVPIQTLGQEDFIKILIAQLTTQDPMNPQKDTEFIAQMAQFSQLENSKTMTGELQNLRMQQDFLKANSLIGRVVQFSDGQDAGYVGTVTGMTVENGVPMLAVGDQTFSLNAVQRVQNGTPGRTHAG